MFQRSGRAVTAKRFQFNIRRADRPRSVLDPQNSFLTIGKTIVSPKSNFRRLSRFSQNGAARCDKLPADWHHRCNSQLERCWGGACLVLERCLPACLMHASEDLGAPKKQILAGITRRIREFRPEVLERCWRGACLLACMHALQTWVLRSSSFSQK